jgi:hypothetical protein
MKTYIVDVFHEDSSDGIEFANKAAKKLKEHIERLSEIDGKPSLQIECRIYGEEKPFHRDHGDARPRYNQPKTGFSSLTITNESIGGCYYGYGGPYPEGRLACVNRRWMEEVDENHTGNGSVDITIHEWLHTLYKEEVNGKIVPSPHDQQKYAYEGEYMTDESGRQHGWVNWYRALLTGKYESKARPA